MKTLSVAAIEQGSVIDHIPCGFAIKILDLLNLNDGKHQITIGMHLPSKLLGKKDLLKINGLPLLQHETEIIALFAPLATVNNINNYKITEKFNVKVPNNISGIFLCPNPSCVASNSNIAKAEFKTNIVNNIVKCVCEYCEKHFELSQMKKCSLLI